MLNFLLELESREMIYEPDIRTTPTSCIKDMTYSYSLSPI